MTIDERKEIAKAMQDIGDAISGSMDQMLKGNWRDDHGHEVKMNAAIVRLGAVLQAMVEFRKNNP